MCGNSVQVFEFYEEKLIPRCQDSRLERMAAIFSSHSHSPSDCPIYQVTDKLFFQILIKP